MSEFISNQPIDQQVRFDALDPQTSFAVSAPAGSGKTGLLTQRVLTLLAYCDEPEEVLAITFTRKAAGEMQDRIMHALWQAADQPEPQDPHALRTWQLAQKVLQRDRELQWNLLQSPQRLRVQTIDSLCRSITKQLPLASGIGAQPDTLEDADQAYRLAVRELFKLLEQESPLRDDLTRLLRHLDNNLQAVENLLISLLAKREQWLGVLLQARHEDARAYLEQVLRDVVCEHLDLLAAALLIHSSELCSIADRAATNLQEEAERKNRIHELLGINGLPDAEPESLNQWLSLVDLLLTNGGTFRARLTKAEGFPAGKENAELKNRFSELIAAITDTAPEAEQLLQELRSLPAPHYAEHQWQLLDSLTSILPILVAQLTIVFKQQSATDYTAISQAALLALGDEDSPSDLALQLDYRIRHILVDEFQDTASPQLELLKKLTSGWQASDGRTLFIVGDGMQSCYGFRNANVGLFLDARQQGIGSVDLTALDLRVNFRSQAGVVNWVNDIFQHAFPAQDDISRGAVSYSPSVAFKPAIDGDAVTFYACTYTTEKSDESDSDDNEPSSRVQAQQQEAATVVELVQQARYDNPNGSVAILVRTRNHLARILPALSAAGLHYQATEIDRLASRMAIMDLLSLTRALLNPADRIAWLSVLRAPWCGLDNNDLHCITTANLAGQNPRINETAFAVLWRQLELHEQISGLSANGKIILARVVPLLAQALQERYRKPLRQWIEGIWFALGGPATLLDANDRDNINSFFALLDKHQQGGSIRDWQAFNNAIERLFAAPRADADPKLQVMTIHKSKGLEFDTVIIPGLDRSARKDDKQLLLWQERINHQGEKQLLLGSLAATGKEEEGLYTFMRREADKQQAFEATRLLYVGCTRAIKRLHLIACINTKEDELVAPAKVSLLHSIWPYVKDNAQRIDSTRAIARNDSFDNNNAKPGLQHILRLPANWQAPALSDVTLLKAYRGHEFSMSENDNPLNIPEVETTGARLARHTGTVIHNALQAIVENKLVTNNSCISADTFINQQHSFWKIQLQQLGWSGDNLNRALQKIATAITNTINSEQGRWLLNCEHEQSACELSLMQKEKQDVREHIIDRTFIADGIRWIVDYKSSEPESGEPENSFIKREVNTYTQQLKKYESVLTEIDSLPISLAIYFTSLGLFSIIQSEN
ncbi:UvrD-helicase domain-containing protein [Cellvibrio sp. OA-2007]|uniref:UvrD-helicase domain-containing protein n=1 Tax=Cellvibrio sp. OA-2007 TaxID=529823 RepID=UPI000781EE6A|nr:UvrD-helicase domain-containing protein [Cellvibrio sp. OA-2007]